MNKDVIDSDVILGPVVAKKLDNNCINNLVVEENHEKEHLRTPHMHNNTHIDGEESTSSYDSEFVEETQPNALQVIVVEVQSSKEEAITEIQNKNEFFLKNSCANMTDVNENEAISEE